MVKGEKIGSEVKLPVPQNVDYGHSERLQSLIDAHGEVSLLRQLANAIRKNVRLNVNFATGQITVTVAGEVVADRTIKR